MGTIIYIFFIQGKIEGWQKYRTPPIVDIMGVSKNSLWVESIRKMIFVGIYLRKFIRAEVKS